MQVVHLHNHIYSRKDISSSLGKTELSRSTAERLGGQDLKPMSLLRKTLTEVSLLSTRMDFDDGTT
jgi:hypothetical protein